MTVFAFGADEAGRGPAIGSMFAAAVAVDPETSSDPLPDGLADSKQLSPERRTQLARQLRASDAVRIGLAEIPPERIDDPKTDMNQLTVVAQAQAIESVICGGERGIVDACDVDEERFAARVTDRIDKPLTIVAEHGADDRYDLVAAASVIAKVERDAHVDSLTAEYGDVGSGYPADPTTREFLTAYVETHRMLPDCARQSWSTCREVLAVAGQRGLDEF